MATLIASLNCVLQEDDSIDKDANDLDGDCSRPQKHAKSPELAREFLLDAATVIFKEQACYLQSSWLVLSCHMLLFFDEDKSHVKVSCFEKFY